MDVGIRVVLDRFEILFVLVLVVNIDNVSVGIVSQRIALENVSLVAGVLDALQRLANGGTMHEAAHMLETHLFEWPVVC